MSCPYYQAQSQMGNATCRAGKVGEWISGSKETEKSCSLLCRECGRYERKAGIEDKELTGVTNSYMKNLFGKDFEERFQNPICSRLLKEEGKSRRVLSGKLKEIGNEVSRRCPDYRKGYGCTWRINGCFLWDSWHCADYCKWFEKNIDISIKKLDELWGSKGKRGRQRTLLKRAIIQILLEKGRVTRKDILRLKVMPSSTVRTNFDKICENDLKLNPTKGRGKDKKYNVYKDFGKKWYLKRELKDL